MKIKIEKDWKFKEGRYTVEITGINHETNEASVVLYESDGNGFGQTWNLQGIQDGFDSGKYEKLPEEINLGI